MVGAFHTTKIAALTRHSGTTEYIPHPGLLLSAKSVSSLEEKIGSLNLGEGDILNLDLYSNTVYMGSDKYGMPVPVFPVEAIQLIRNLLQQTGNATIICVLPLPRYVRHPCCNDELHMVNWAEADFNNILMSGSTACFGILKSEGEKHGLTIATFNPLSCFSSAEDLSEIRSSAGLSILSIWREDDAVHLTAAAFNDIVAVLSN